MKISVLFVDDDPDILRGLKRILRSKQGWETFFAEGGAKALEILAEHDIGVVVLDMRMPGMNGLELLTTVQEHHPHVIRIVLSGYTDQEVVLRSAKLAHQFFAKPCEADVLIKSIEHTWLLRDLINNERLRDLITGITDLPSLPSAYVQLIEYMQSPDASIRQIGDIIASDMTMTAKVLQLVNSAFFSLPQEVVDPSRAVALLGMENLKALLLCVHIFSTFDSSKEIRPYVTDLWKHSIMVGSLAKGDRCYGIQRPGNNRERSDRRGTA